MSDLQSAAAAALARIQGTVAPVAEALGQVQQLESAQTQQLAAAPHIPETPVNIPGGISVQLLAEQLIAQQQQMAEQQRLIDRLLGKAAEQEPTQERKRKVYYHRVEGSSFVVMRKGPGNAMLPETHHFYGGVLITKDPLLQDELDGICDMPGSPVTSRHPSGKDVLLQEAALEVVHIAERTIDKLGAEAAVVVGKPG